MLIYIRIHGCVSIYFREGSSIVKGKKISWAVNTQDVNRCRTGKGKGCHSGNVTLFMRAAICKIPCAWPPSQHGLPPSKGQMALDPEGCFGLFCSGSLEVVWTQCVVSWTNLKWIGQGLGGFACVWLQLGKTQQPWFRFRLSFWVCLNPRNETWAARFNPALGHQSTSSIFLKRCKVKPIQNRRVLWETASDLMLPCVLAFPGTGWDTATVHTHTGTGGTPVYRKLQDACWWGALILWASHQPPVPGIGTGCLGKWACRVFTLLFSQATWHACWDVTTRGIWHVCFACGCLLLQH